MAFLDFLKKKEVMAETPTVIDTGEKQSFNNIPKQYDYNKQYQERYNERYVYLCIDKLYLNVLADVYNRKGLYI